MNILRNLVALIATLQFIGAHAFFVGPAYPAYGPYPYYGPYWGGKGAAIAAGVGTAGGIISSAITADAIKKSNPEYLEYKTAQEDRRAAEAQERAQAREEGRAYRRGFQGAPRGYNP